MSVLDLGWSLTAEQPGPRANQCYLPNLAFGRLHRRRGAQTRPVAGDLRPQLPGRASASICGHTDSRALKRLRKLVSSGCIAHLITGSPIQLRIFPTAPSFCVGEVGGATSRTLGAARVRPVELRCANTSAAGHSGIWQYSVEQTSRHRNCIRS